MKTDPREIYNISCTKLSDGSATGSGTFGGRGTEYTMAMREVTVGNVRIGGNRNPLVFIAGPCVIEDPDSTLKAAHKLKQFSEDLNISIIFKSSYDKANRTSIHSFRGPGIEEGLSVLERVKRETGLPVLSDVHSPDEVTAAAGVLDVLQVPAFLCRQTDLLTAAGKSGRPVNIKKGQFMSPWSMKHVIDKVRSTGNNDIILTERGVSFGYHNLVVDMRSIIIMRQFGFPVMYDATHGIQLPGGRDDTSGGEREFIPPLSRAAVSAGCDAIFMEVHASPETALCDGPNMLMIDHFPLLAQQLVQLSAVVREWEGGENGGF